MLHTYLLSIQDQDPTKPLESFGEKLSYGGQMLLLGMATVFAVLCILWACLVIFKMLFHDLPAKKTKTADTVEQTVTEPVVEQTDDGEIIAAIAAAIAMAESECEQVKFRVVSFRRK